MIENAAKPSQFEEDERLRKLAPNTAHLYSVRGSLALAAR
jgi:hypothetical protein